MSKEEAKTVEQIAEDMPNRIQIAAEGNRPGGTEAVKTGLAISISDDLDYDSYLKIFAQAMLAMMRWEVYRYTNTAEQLDIDVSSIKEPHDYIKFALANELGTDLAKEVPEDD